MAHARWRRCMPRPEPEEPRGAVGVVKDPLLDCAGGVGQGIVKETLLDCAGGGGAQRQDDTRRREWKRYGESEVAGGRE